MDNRLVPALELDNVSLTYTAGPVWSRTETMAVRSVSLRVEKAETVGLVGESGSGKTSIGRLSLGMVAPTSGSVRLNAFPLTPRHRRFRGELQVVPQHPEW